MEILKINYNSDNEINYFYDENDKEYFIKFWDIINIFTNNPSKRVLQKYEGYSKQLFSHKYTRRINDKLYVIRTYLENAIGKFEKKKIFKQDSIETHQDKVLDIISELDINNTNNFDMEIDLENNTEITNKGKEEDDNDNNINTRSEANNQELHSLYESEFDEEEEEEEEEQVASRKRKLQYDVSYSNDDENDEDENSRLERMAIADKRYQELLDFRSSVKDSKLLSNAIKRANFFYTVLNSIDKTHNDNSNRKRYKFGENDINIMKENFVNAYNEVGKDLFGFKPLYFYQNVLHNVDTNNIKEDMRVTLKQRLEDVFNLDFTTWDKELQLDLLKELGCKVSSLYYEKYKELPVKLIDPNYGTKKNGYTLQDYEEFIDDIIREYIKENI